LKQGAHNNFIPLVGAFISSIKAVQTHGDFMAPAKQLIKANPNVRWEISNIGATPLIVLYDPQLIKEVIKNQDCYKKSELIFSPMTVILGEGLVTAEGATWKKHRKVVSQSFHFEFLKSQLPLIVSTTREFLDKIPESGLKKVKMMDEFQKITGEVIGRIFFGNNLNEYSIDGQPLTLVLSHLIADVAEAARGGLRILLGDTIYWKTPAMKRLLGRVRVFRNVCEEIVNQRISSKAEKKDKKDMLDYLLEQQQQGGEDAMSNKEIVDEFCSFFLAGMDTTGHVITMLAYNLLQNPQYLKEVQNEIDSKYPSKSQDITLEKLKELTSLELALKETLRFNPPSTGLIPRDIIKDHKLGDIKLKKGAMLTAGFLMNNYNTKYYEEPHLFQPERWLEPKTKENESNNIFMPFFSGPRNCIGQHLSQMETQIIFAEFIRKYSYNVSESYVHRMTFRLLYEPDQDMIFDLKLRT
jgi:cytochrome P450